MWKHGLHPYIVEAASTQYEKKPFLAAGIQAVKNMTTSLMRRRANICNIISHKAAALHACATVSNQSVNRRLSRCKAINLGMLDSAAGPISARVEGVVVSCMVGALGENRSGVACVLGLASNLINRGG